MSDEPARDTMTAAVDRPFARSADVPPVPGLVLRHVRAPADYPAMNAIANAIRMAEGSDFLTSDVQFQQFYDNLPDSDPAEDVAVAELHGRIVGYGRAASRQESDGPRIYESLPFVDPAVAGEAVFVAMLVALEGRLRVLAANQPPGEKVLQTFGGDRATDRDALLRRNGYTPVRFFNTMVRPGMDDLPDAPMPPGLEIREVQPDQLPAIWAAEQEAFLDHWGNAPATDGDYERFVNDPVQSDTSLWRVAWEGHEVAGMVRSFINADENEQLHRRRGYVEHISTRRPWRRRGLARALIAASFPLLRARGMDEAALAVDTENVSGALRVYENCGFRPVARNALYRKPLG